MVAKKLTIPRFIEECVLSFSSIANSGLVTPVTPKIAELFNKPSVIHDLSKEVKAPSESHAILSGLK
jgi:hypothetical protein